LSTGILCGAAVRANRADEPRFGRSADRERGAGDASAARRRQRKGGMSRAAEKCQISADAGACPGRGGHAGERRNSRTITDTRQRRPSSAALC
jgi:hypothetical protein